MSRTAIRIENLGKKYRIGTNRNSYKTLRDTLASNIASPFYRVGKILRSQANGPADLDKEFWALRNVSVEVNRGEVLGIIGSNGAGKSTLLKILSQITEPTTGIAEVHGRVGSLLEVGTGFHGELTGRENVYLNGAILGMTSQEIRRKFDEIVAFAEVEKFIDTPLKHYSSGMYMRLAFAVAAHFEPDILLIDEVLAVGDETFQKKCLGKMDYVAKEGRTVLFVSHNMASIRSLCQSAIILESGKLTFSGPSSDATDKYLTSEIHREIGHFISFARPKESHLWMESVAIFCNGVPTKQLHMGETLTLEINFSSTVPIRNPTLGYLISSSRGDPILSANNHYQNTSFASYSTQSGIISCKLGVLPLMKGQYPVSLWLSNGIHDYHYVENALSFEVVEKDIWGKGRSPQSNSSFLWWPTDFEIT